MMRWSLHHLVVDAASNDPRAQAHWQRSFASRPAASGPPDLVVRFDVVTEVPPRPPGEPQFRQGDALAYYLDERVAVAHFPRFGQLRLDLANGATEGRIVPAALTTYGVFEDLVAIGLSPHLRRRGLFLIHAFSAASGGDTPLRQNRMNEAVLLVGAIGSGKTTTGMALLNAGWKLLSNDSPILDAPAEVLSYPGLLAAYPDTFARFEATRDLAQSQSASDGRHKVSAAAEAIWPDVWIDSAPAGAIFFPQIESRPDSVAEPIAHLDALRRLLPHAVEQWDRGMIAEHLRLLKNLVEAAPAYVLRLGRDVTDIPHVLESVLRRAR